MNHPLERILVATDGSPESESIFPAVMPLVRAYNPEVALLYVVEDPDDPMVAPESVAKACAALRASNVNAYLELRGGDPARGILTAAREGHCGLIALCIHGRTGAVRWIGGSVAEEVIRHSELPVLLTRPGVPVHHWKRIVVPLDGSERAEVILPLASRMSRALGAPVELLRVALPMTVVSPGDGAIVLPPEDPMPYLEKIAGKLQAEGVPTSAVGMEGGASASILAHLEESPDSLLCMATHGRTGLVRFLMGSVAEQVIRRTPCPVLLQKTVPAPLVPGGQPKESLRA